LLHSTLYSPLVSVSYLSFSEPSLSPPVSANLPEALMIKWNALLFCHCAHCVLSKSCRGSLLGDLVSTPQRVHLTMCLSYQACTILVLGWASQRAANLVINEGPHKGADYPATVCRHWICSAPEQVCGSWVVRAPDFVLCFRQPGPGVHRVSMSSQSQSKASMRSYSHSLLTAERSNSWSRSHDWKDRASASKSLSPAAFCADTRLCSSHICVHVCANCSPPVWTLLFHERLWGACKCISSFEALSSCHKFTLAARRSSEITNLISFSLSEQLAWPVGHGACGATVRTLVEVTVHSVLPTATMQLLDGTRGHTSS
jgi:hypothetical protein